MTDIVKKLEAALVFDADKGTIVELLAEVRELVHIEETVVTQLRLIAMAKKNNPNMAAGPALDLLGDVVDELCRAVNFDE